MGVRLARFARSLNFFMRPDVGFGDFHFALRPSDLPFMPFC
jgi:hypothetical protein